MRKILYTVYHNNNITFYQRDIVKSCEGFSFNHIFDIYDLFGLIMIDIYIIEFKI